jgi:hypothetical protein
MDFQGQRSMSPGQILMRNILVNTRINVLQWILTKLGTYLDLKIHRFPDSPKYYVCTKFGQNLLKDVDSRVFTRMLCGKNLTR